MIEELQVALRTNKGYLESWVANIAMAYQDSEHWFRQEHNKQGKYLNKSDKHLISNNAANHFIKQLIS